MKRKIECVLLDAGGVLVYPRFGDWRSTPRWDEFCADAFAAFTDAQIEAAKREAGNIFLDESLIMADEDVEFACRRNYFLEIAKILGAKLPESLADALARDMTENDARYGFYDDARAGVIALGEKFRLCLLSDAMPSLLRVLDNAGFTELLDGRVISTRVGATKPDAKMYAAATELMEIVPSACAFVDDKIENLVGAENAGMLPIHMARGIESTWHGARAENLFDVLRITEAL